MPFMRISWEPYRMTPHIIIPQSDLEAAEERKRITLLVSIAGQLAWFGIGCVVGANWQAIALAVGRLL